MIRAIDGLIALMFLGFGLYVVSKPVAYLELFGDNSISDLARSEIRMLGGAYLAVGTASFLHMIGRLASASYYHLLIICFCAFLLSRVITVVAGDVNTAVWIAILIELLILIYAWVWKPVSPN